MIGSLKINGTDLADFGVFILRGGDHDFLTMPERVEPDKNNWYEYNGLDVDLSEIYFKGRTLSVDFYISARSANEYEYNLQGFYRLLTDGHIELYMREFARSFTLRYVDNTEYNHKGGLYKKGDKRGKISIEFAMDDPLQLFTDPTILVPISPYQHRTNILLNNIDLGAFGIIASEAYSSFLKLSPVKKPLTRTFSRFTGAKAYPNQNPTFEAKELVIQCTMRAASRIEFYYNYQALFNNLAKTEALQIGSYLGDAECYYNKMTDFKKIGNFGKRVMVQFTLRLIQLDVGLVVFVLATEDKRALLTESEEYIEVR